MLVPQNLKSEVNSSQPWESSIFSKHAVEWRSFAGILQDSMIRTWGYGTAMLKGFRDLRFSAKDPLEYAINARKCADRRREGVTCIRKDPSRTGSASAGALPRQQLGESLPSPRTRIGVWGSGEPS